jgi:uncharacterized membrane protein YeaQ/YmgE (transglycosylase-associated protein family)
MSTLASMSLFLLFGLIVGALARLARLGHEPGGWSFSLLLGVAGSLSGGLVGRAIGIYAVSEPAGFVMSILGAMIFVGIHRALRARRHAHA